MKNKTIITQLITIITLILILTACQKTTTPTVITGFYFDTVISVTIYENIPENLEKEIHIFLQDYDNMLSETNTESDLYRINHSSNTTISNETAYLIAKSLEYAEATEGILDPTIYTVSSLYTFDSQEQIMPSDTHISKALSHTGYQKLQLINNEDNENQLLKEDSETMIGLGYIAKGYIADRLKDFLISKGINNALINLGGNLVTIGQKPDGSSFIIGIEKPFEKSTPAVTLQIPNDSFNTSIVTSGIYERYFTYNHELYHHLLNTSTGLPLNNELYSCSIIGPESETCDVLSTLCYLYGYEKASEYLTKYPEYHGIFIFRDYSVKYSLDFPMDIISN